MVSIIIPVFNNEKTIGKTLQSVAEQSYSDYEVIVINDGSTDASLEEIRRFTESDPRFSLIDQENKGVSAARNAGLDAAAKKYIMFVDGDDLLPKNALKWMFQIQNVNDADTVVGAYERIDGTEARINIHSKHQTRKALRIQHDDLDIIHSWTLCNKWLSRDIIEKHHIRFDGSRHLEDAVFLYTYLQYADRIYTCAHTIYSYIKPLPIMGRTTTQNVSASLLKDARSSFKKVEQLTADYGEDFHKELIYRYLSTPLIGDYYRRLWRFHKNTADSICDEIERLSGELDDERRNRLKVVNSDLFDSYGNLMRHDDILTAPLVSIVLTNKISGRNINNVLDGLYDQGTPTFCILADDRLRKYVRADTVPNNFNWVKEDSILDVLRKTGSKYVVFVDTDMLFNHDSLRQMVRVLDNNDVDIVSALFEYYDGSQIRESDLMNCSYSQGIEELDAFFANKILRNTDRMLEIISDAQDASELLRQTSHKRIDTPKMISLISDDKLIARIRSRKATREYRAFMKEKTPSFSKRAKSKLRRLAKKFRHNNTPAPKKKKARKNVVDYYYDNIIDPNLIVIEGLGKRPKGNTLYLLRELQKEKYKNFRIAFSVRKDNKEITSRILAREGMENVTLITAGSKKYKRTLFSAGYLFNEVDFPNWWIKKPGQIYVNIWHGTPLKKLGKKKSGVIHQDANASRNFTMADYILFANDYSIEHILMDADVGGLAETIGLMVGYPRTGELFDTEKGEEVRKREGIEGKNVSIWMPTWNDDHTDEMVNRFLAELDAELDDSQIMYVNLHHRSMVTVDYSVLKHIRQFPEEYDIYEFLTCSDVLVTDYSSIFFDYAACRKKIILHCPDKDEYRGSRGLYMEPEDLPFPVTTTTEQLAREIREPKEYDDTAFLEEYNRYDSGANTEKLCEHVLLGVKDNIEERYFHTEPGQVFIVCDSFEPGKTRDYLTAIHDNGRWPENCWLSFPEKSVDGYEDVVYPILHDVRIYATKGEPLDKRSERKRLYGDLNIDRYVLIDPEDHNRIRAFRWFSEPVELLLTERQVTAMKDGDEDLVKAVKMFNQYGNGIFTLSEADTITLRDRFHIPAETIDSMEAFYNEFFAN